MLFFSWKGHEVEWGKHSIKNIWYEGTLLDKNKEENFLFFTPQNAENNLRGLVFIKWLNTGCLGLTRVCHKQDFSFQQRDLNAGIYI